MISTMGKILGWGVKTTKGGFKKDGDNANEGDDTDRGSSDSASDSEGDDDSDDGHSADPGTENLPASASSERHKKDVAKYGGYPRLETNWDQQMRKHPAWSAMSSRMCQYTILKKEIC